MSIGINFQGIAPLVVEGHQFPPTPDIPNGFATVMVQVPDKGSVTFFGQPHELALLGSHIMDEARRVGREAADIAAGIEAKP